MLTSKMALVATLAGLLASGTAAASVLTWAPTDNNVNILPTATPITTGTLGFFDNNNTTYNTSYGYLAVNTGGDTLNFSPNPVGQTSGSYTVTNDALNSTTVTNGPYFTLAYNAGLGGGFQQPDSTTCNNAAGSCTLSWNVGGSTLAVDLETAVPPSAVPLPAAVWLFSSGLVGLVGVGRRRRKELA